MIETNSNTNHQTNRNDLLLIHALRIWSGTIEDACNMDKEFLLLAHEGVCKNFREEQGHPDNLWKIVEAFSRQLAIADCLNCQADITDFLDQVEALIKDHSQKPSSL